MTPMTSLGKESYMKIYIFPNGNWFYDWEIYDMMEKHGVDYFEDGRWIDIDKHLGYDLTDAERQACEEALGRE